ncbi:MAG TPA: helix-turn-helix domain-containing protein [Acidimicrobiales bacterium]|jgi:excisionase family DNA binding protein|nr:helix-turn-helix domain-containing protein [Acidimicrobiales bacterium]
MDDLERARRLVDAIDELERRRRHESDVLRAWVVRLLDLDDPDFRVTSGHVGSMFGRALPGVDAAADTRPDGLLLDLDGVAAELAVSVSTVKRLVAAGHLPAVKVLGATRVRRADLEHYVAELRTEGKTTA